MTQNKSLSFKNATLSEIALVEAAIKKSLFFIPSINGGELLERMLPTLRIPPQTIIVLDQGSTDTTDFVCKKYGVEILQLDNAHSYTQCCNISLEIAQKREVSFFYIANNDITFTTDVARELIFEAMNDETLGIVSCSQLIVENEDDIGILSNRVYWDLSTTTFEHDTSILPSNIERLESDFCELTCAIIRTSSAIEIGGFDNDYEFYHEDADFGFRLRQAGYTAAYLPQSQFKHFAGSTFREGQAERRLSYIKNSRKIFTEKHLGYGLNYVDHRNDAATSWNIVNKNLFPYMTRFGLVDSDRPQLFFAHPGIEPHDCLYSVWETSRLPSDWMKFKDSYISTYLASSWNQEVFQNAGFTRTHYVPLGVETDTFQPWGPSERNFDGPTFLWFARNQYRKGLDLMLEAWSVFSADHPSAILIVLGHGILSSTKINRAFARQFRGFVIFDDLDAKISYRETLIPIENAQLASIYRSVDYLVLTSRSEGFGFSVVEAMACGVLTIFPSYSSTYDMQYEGSLNFGGQEKTADYSDKYFSDVGKWWEPNPTDIVAAMEKAVRLEISDRKQHLRRAMNLVRSKFTWRDTCFAIRSDLVRWQEKKSVPYQFTLGKNIPQGLNILQYAMKIVQKEEENISESSFKSFDIEKIFKEFDPSFYLKFYADIKKANIDPLSHYIGIGWVEERNPSEYFSTRNYLAANSAVCEVLLSIHDAGGKFSNRAISSRYAEWQLNKLAHFANEPEVSDALFLFHVYRVLLNREPDAEGLVYYENKLTGSVEKRINVINLIMASNERSKVYPFNQLFFLPCSQAKFKHKIDVKSKKSKRKWL